MTQSQSKEVSPSPKQSQPSEQGDFWWIYGGAFLLVAIGLWIAMQFVQPAPPSSISIAAGYREGANFHYAQRYAELLARQGIQLEVLATNGSVDNLERVLAPGGADIAIVQGGVADQRQREQLSGLGSIFYEPIWVLGQGERNARQLNDLAGQRIAVGPVGSGTQVVAQRVLQRNGIDEERASIVSRDFSESADLLIAGELDLMFLVSAADAPLLARLLAAENVYVHDIERAQAYARTSPFLSALTLPRGALDLAHDRPAQETNLIATTASLVARPDIHPALVELLVQVAAQVHGGAGLFNGAGAFPSPDGSEFPLNPGAERHYEHGPPFLQRFLPFWAATLIDRLKIMLLPLIGLLFPLFKIAPPLYRWRVRQRILRWYRELRAIDKELAAVALQDEQRDALRVRLDHLDSEAAEVHVPLAYTDQLYNLRLHIQLLREKSQSKPSLGR